MFSRALPLSHEEVESMSPTLEPRWAFMTASSSNNTVYLLKLSQRNAMSFCLALLQC